MFCSLFCFSSFFGDYRYLHSFPTRRSSDLARLVWHRRPLTFVLWLGPPVRLGLIVGSLDVVANFDVRTGASPFRSRSEEHTSELQSLRHLVCRLLLEKKKKNREIRHNIYAA